MHHENDFDLWVCCEDKCVCVYDCDEGFLDWILMIALSRHKCFHFPKMRLRYK